MVDDDTDVGEVGAPCGCRVRHIRMLKFRKISYNPMNKNEASSANKWLEKDRSVWVKALPQYPNPYEDAFLEGKVVDINDKEIMLDLVQSEARVKSPIENVLKLTYGINDVSDMVDLQELNEPELLFNIKRRYMNDLIFTYCGPTLVIINPYAFIEKLFNDSILQEYQTMVFTDNLEYKSLPPHVFALAAFCLWQLFDNQRNQSIVISGESGAGKTENTKYCLKFLASLGKNMKQLVSDPSQKGLDSNKNKRINYQNMRTAEKAIKKGSKVFGIQQKILGCNQILEAFGNSKTIRNDNSSRFGKLILLVYGETQIDIKSAFIISYLLEKSRIVSVSDGERNYHIFYYFCKGTTNDEKAKYKLNDPMNKYYYLNQSSTYDLPKGSDEEKFLQIKKQFDMYLKPEETDCVYRILSIVLNIGNIVFKKGENKNNEEVATITNEQYIKYVTELLEVDYQEFMHCFQFKTRKMGVNVINSPLRFDEALALRDSLAKNIYEKIFNFLVAKLNEKIQIEKIDFDGVASRESRKSIGLLDIFGFEVLLINSLEQFFINFANQKLQQLYVSYIFKEEKNQFLKEGLKEFSHDIGFQDNKPIIDLFELYPLGIFHLVNQSSQLNKPDENLPETIIKNHKFPFISIPKSKKNHFQIDHSCSSVSYNTIGFTAKNKDQFPKQVLEVIKKSRNEHLRKIVVGEEKEDDSRTKKASSKFLGSKFLSEMNKLIEQLYSCDCHFVRCIKPNSKKASKLFNSEAVLQSLRYLGVLDSIKIRKLGYIYRRPYKQFFKKFYELERYIYSYQLEIQGKSQDDFKEQSRKIVEKYAKKELMEKDILFGSKKILIKQSTLNHLELLTKEKRRMRVQVANRVKVMYKNAVFRVQVQHFSQRIRILKESMLQVAKRAKDSILNRKVVRVQNVIRKYLWYLRLQKIKQEATKSVTKISAYLKMKKQRKAYLERRGNIIKLQCNIRTFLSMRYFYKEKVCFSVISAIFASSWEIIQNRKAVLIQKKWKGYKIRSQFQQILKLMKIRAFLKRAILKLRVAAFKQLLNLHKKPVLKLQAIVKSRYLRRTYLKIKKSVVIIQKAYRRHLQKRFYLQKAWKNYEVNLTINESEKLEEVACFGFSLDPEQRVKPTAYSTSASIQKLSGKELRWFLQNSTVPMPDLRINQPILFADKNTIQMYIVDADILSTVTYRGKWARKYATLKTDLARKQEYAVKVTVSECFTTVLTNKDRLYSFGPTSEQTDDPFSKTQLKTSSMVICLADQSIYMASKQMELYEWGDNKNEELFSQHEEKAFRLSPQVSFPNVIDVQVKGFNRYFVTSDGKVHKKDQGRLRIVQINRKVPIQSVVSSYDFTHFLGSNGQIFSFGSNKRGELGLDTNQHYIGQPTLNEYFVVRKQSVECVSVGLSHTVIKTKLGYVYTWGANKFGQASPQVVAQLNLPVLLELDKQKVKVLQCVAGARATYLLTQNFVVIGLGRSEGINSCARSGYSEIDLLQKTTSNSKNLIPLKIYCTWNRQMSLLTMNCLEMNKCKPGTKPDVILKYCKLIAKDWPEKQIYPTYHEWMDNTLNLGDMRKFKFQKPPHAKPSATVAKNSAQSQAEQLKVLMDLRKTSKLFKIEARRKIERVLKRLAAKSSGAWTKEDHELSLYVKQCCKIVMK